MAPFAARPTALRHLVVVMDSVPLDLLDLSDKQTIAMQVPSADNQVPRLDSLRAVHSHDLTHAPAPKQPLASEQNCAAPTQPCLRARTVGKPSTKPSTTGKPGSYRVTKDSWV